MPSNGDRITRLEEWRTDIVDPHIQGADERKEHLNMRFDHLEADVKDIKNILSKMLWIFIGAIIIGFAEFIIRGGLLS